MSRKLPFSVKTWKISLPSHIAARVELRLPAPSGGKPQYAARSKLITALLEEWLNDIDTLSTETPESYNEEMETIHGPLGQG